MAEKRAVVDEDDFTMDKAGLQLDYDLLGDWPDTRKHPTHKAPKERGTNILIAYASKLGRGTESTHRVRKWLLDHMP